MHINAVLLFIIQHKQSHNLYFLLWEETNMTLFADCKCYNGFELKIVIIFINDERNLGIQKLLLRLIWLIVIYRKGLGWVRASRFAPVRLPRRSWVWDSADRDGLPGNWELGRWLGSPPPWCSTTRRSSSGWVSSGGSGCRKPRWGESSEFPDWACRYHLLILQ